MYTSGAPQDRDVFKMRSKQNPLHRGKLQTE